MMIFDLFNYIKGRLVRSPSPALIPVRVNNKKTAVFFIHGFTGRSDATWKEMIALLLEDKALSSWDVFSLGFPSAFSVDFPGVWSADPSLDTIALALKTTLSVPPASGYEGLAIVAHSMGGLVAQRALCDSKLLSGSITHLVLYGVPSRGLIKASLLARLKRQLRDMADDGPFIRQLGADWDSLFGVRRPFKLVTIAGDQDEFVSGFSSLEPFEEEVRMVVPGNHLSMIRPAAPSDQSYSILANLLSGRFSYQTALDGAEVALELRAFHKVIDSLWPSRFEIDDKGLVTLALALESVGRRPDALAILQSRTQQTSSTDVRGTLAGRLKRRWLSGRVRADFDASCELYWTCLHEAEASGDRDQAFYHSINVAFLDLMSLNLEAPVSQSVSEMARRALDHCNASPVSKWMLATKGDANLILGKTDEAMVNYSRAVSLATPRELDSIASQAMRIAVRVHGQKMADQLQAILNRSKS